MSEESFPLGGGTLTRRANSKCPCSTPSIDENNLLLGDKWICVHENTWIVRPTYGASGEVTSLRWGQTRPRKKKT